MYTYSNNVVHRIDFGDLVVKSLFRDRLVPLFPTRNPSPLSTFTRIKISVCTSIYVILLLSLRLYDIILDFREIAVRTKTFGIEFIIYAYNTSSDV